MVMRNIWIVAAALAVAGPAMAADVGLIKVSKGSVQIQRGGEKLPAAVGSAVQPSDVIVTGADGSAGVAVPDHNLVSVRPHSLVAIDKDTFDHHTHTCDIACT